MPFIQISHCGNANTETLEIANEIASICESEKEFWAEVDKQFSCSMPGCYCSTCATREALYGVCVEVHLTTEDKDTLREEARACYHAALANGYAAGEHGSFCLTPFDVGSISDAVGYDVSELQEAMDILGDEITVITQSTQEKAAEALVDAVAFGDETKAKDLEQHIRYRVAIEAIAKDSRSKVQPIRKTYTNESDAVEISRKINARLNETNEEGDTIFVAVVEPIVLAADCSTCGTTVII